MDKENLRLSPEKLSKILSKKLSKELKRTLKTAIETLLEDLISDNITVHFKDDSLRLLVLIPSELSHSGYIETYVSLEDLSEFLSDQDDTSEPTKEIIIKYRDWLQQMTNRLNNILQQDEKG